MNWPLGRWSASSGLQRSLTRRDILRIPAILRYVDRHVGDRLEFAVRDPDPGRFSVAGFWSGNAQTRPVLSHEFYAPVFADAEVVTLRVTRDAMPADAGSPTPREELPACTKRSRPAR
jgi:hypothetical protein